jgi:sugar lactone lactonase YvrE
MQWETVLSLLASLGSTLAVLAYASGILRQRIVELERRMEAAERVASDQATALAAALQDIRDRVIAIDEWRRHFDVRRVRRTRETPG